MNMEDNQDDVVGVQQCTKCKLWLPLTDYTWRDKAHTLRACWCKWCSRISTKASRQKKLKHYQDVNRAWNIAHSEQLRRTARLWFDKNREAINAGRRKKYAETRKVYRHTPRPDPELDAAIQEWLSEHEGGQGHENLLDQYSPRR